MKSYFCADAKCPFYQGDDGHSAVSCEGVLKATCLKLSFNTNKPQEEKDRLRKHIQKLCGGDFKACPIFQMIMKENYPEEKT